MTGHEREQAGDAAVARAGAWFGLVSTAATAVVVGFASTILLIVEAARAVGASPAQQASWAAALCFGMAATSFILSARYRMPIITAWSTPGAALIATSAGDITFKPALGAFLIAGALMCLTALLAPLARLIEKIPAPIAAAMLAGVLLSYGLKVPGAALALPLVIAPLIAAFFAVRLLAPLYAVPLIVLAGIAAAGLTGAFGARCCGLSLTEPVWTTPEFDAKAILSLGVPLFLVTMASQNLPGFAVLKASGYRPPVVPCLWVTGLASMALSPFGSHAVTMAAITASIVTGPESHPDPSRRWLVAWPYLILYTAVGLGASSLVEILSGLPKPLITTIAGLALFGPLMASAAAMMKEPRDIEAALVTFLITASGLSVFGVGAAFWGLVAGLLLYGARHLSAGRPTKRTGPEAPSSQAK